LERLSEYEFLKYLNAKENYEDLIYRQRITMHRTYLDISPTITTVDVEAGRFYTSGTKVEDYAISIVEMKECMANARTRALKRIEIFDAAISNLPLEQNELITQYKCGSEVANFNALSKALRALKRQLEVLIGLSLEDAEGMAKQHDIDAIEVYKQQVDKILILEQGGKKQYLINGDFQYLTDQEYQERQLMAVQ